MRFDATFPTQVHLLSRDFLLGRIKDSMKTRRKKSVIEKLQTGEELQKCIAVKNQTSVSHERNN